jgi:HK97 family phage major capsid protein
MKFGREVLQELAQELAATGMFPLASDFNKLAADVSRRASQRAASGNDFSITTAIRGLHAKRGAVINPATQAQDIAYAERALDTSTTPGSYLVPTVAASEIIGMLSTGGVARKSGVRIWPMADAQKLSVAVATAFPTVQFLGQNTADTATDPDLAPISFDLKTRRALVVFPNEMIRRTTPAMDIVVTELLGEAFAAHEDTIFFAASAASNGPTPFYSTSGTTPVFVGGSANGGNLAYADILAVLAAAGAASAAPPFVWYMSPRTFYLRVLGLEDGAGHPIVQPDASAPIGFRLFGYPIYVSPAIPNNLANGSGTNQSYIAFTNPKYLHIAESGNIEIATSVERYFELNQTALKIVQGLDLATAPAAGVTLLKGVN